MSAIKNPLKPLIKRIPKQFRNKFIIVLILFFVWMIFFDQSNIMTQWKLKKTVEHLENDKKFYEKKIEEVKKEKKELDEDVEKFAREKYYMKKDGEDVYIIKEKK